MHAIRLPAFAATTLVLLGLAGCSSPRAVVKEPPVSDATPPAVREIASLVRDLTGAILNHPFPSEGEKQPLLVMLGISNRTASPVHTDGLADQITTALTASGKVRFVDSKLCAEWRAGQGLHETASTEEIGIKLARHLGANYVMYGWVSALRSQTVSGSSNAVISRITVELADAETGLVILRKSAP